MTESSKKSIIQFNYLLHRISIGTHISGVLLDLVVVGVRVGHAAAPEAVLAQRVVGAARAAVAEPRQRPAAAGAAAQRVDH